MYKYNGVLVHQSFDDQGVLEIVEENGVRSLHFGTSPKQSSMVIEDPYLLYSPYARAMMAWRLFKTSPENLLMIGLGGGILAKYLLYHYPDSKLDVVEYRKKVVTLARSHFGLPLDNRLTINIGDGASYIKQKAGEPNSIYDMLIIDAYDHKGLAESVNSQAFFDACKALLNPSGMLIVNLWSTDKTLFEQIAWYLGHTFDWRLLFLPARKRGNIIGFAFAEDTPKFRLKQLKMKAEELENQYQIEFPVFLKDFKKNNSKIFNRLIK